MSTHIRRRRRAVRADRLVREYRDEVSRELDRLVRLGRRLGLPDRVVIDVIADIPYRLSAGEAEERLKQLARRGCGGRVAY